MTVQSHDLGSSEDFIVQNVDKYLDYSNNYDKAEKDLETLIVETVSDNPGITVGDVLKRYKKRLADTGKSCEKAREELTKALSVVIFETQQVASKGARLVNGRYDHQLEIRFK
jgi:recombinational DNA repair ATPase RecF